MRNPISFRARELTEGCNGELIVASLFAEYPTATLAEIYDGMVEAELALRWERDTARTGKLKERMQDLIRRLISGQALIREQEIAKMERANA